MILCGNMAPGSLVRITGKEGPTRSAAGLARREAMPPRAVGGSPPASATTLGPASNHRSAMAATLCTLEGAGQAELGMRCAPGGLQALRSWRLYRRAGERVAGRGPQPGALVTKWPVAEKGGVAPGKLRRDLERLSGCGAEARVRLEASIDARGVPLVAAGIGALWRPGEPEACGAPPALCVPGAIWLRMPRLSKPSEGTEELVRALSPRAGSRAFVSSVDRETVWQEPPRAGTP